MTLACARKDNGKLQYVSRASRCTARGGKLVRFSATKPVYACSIDPVSPLRARRRVVPPAHPALGDPAGTLFRIDDPTACGKGTQLGRSTVALPRTKDTKFCAGIRHGTLVMVSKAYPKCNKLEFAVVLKGHKAVVNTPPLAIDDVATIDKDHPTSIAVLSNDSDPDGETLSTASVDTAGTKGAVAIKPDGTVAYDPNGQFPSLSHDQTAHDRFTYKANDGHADSNAATVDVTVTGLNQAPTNLALSGSSVDENQPSGTAVGSLSTTDADAGDSHTYSLVSGTGSTDNAQFQVDGATLKTATPLDFEAGGTRSIRTKTDDGHGGTFEKVFTITVADKNDAPTDVALSPASVDENQPSGTTVGTLSSTDQDAGDSQTYSLVSGTGSTDNAQFQLVGSTLKTAAGLDFEQGATRSVRVKTDDGHGGTFEKALMVTVVDKNDTPTNLALAPASIAENQAAGTGVGTLSTTDQDTADTHTYSLVTGTGDTDNASFTIAGSTLKAAAPFDFETKPSYAIRVKTDDGHGGTFEKALTVAVTDANDVPTNVTLSNAAVDENQPSGTTVGNLSSTDQDPGDSQTYSLVSGTGSTDNAQFQVVGSALKTAAPLDFEAGGTRSVRVKTDDGHGGTFEKQFTIGVNNTNDAPTNLALSPSSVAENQPTATVVGTLSSTDQDAGAAHTYTLVTGAGDADNGAFTITGTTLKTAAIFDFEAKSSYSIRVKTDDGAGGTFEKQFTITVTNVNEAPTDIALSNASVTENQPTNTDVGTFSTTDPDSGDTFAYTLATGTGDDDNGSFTISGNTLKTNAVFDKEAKSSYSIRVQTQDQGGTGLTFQKQFTVSIDDVNDAPTLTAIEATALPYDTGDPGSPITSTLTTGDVDNANLKSGTVKIDTGYLNGSDTLSFAGTATISSGGFDVTTGTLSLTTGAGGAPKSEWDTALQSVKFFSAGPTPSGSRTIRFQVDDGQASDHASNVASRDITVTNDNVAPTDILLSNDTTASGQPSGQTVGTLSSVDSDAGDPHTYTLVSGTGSTDNGSFQITGSTLKTNATLTAADYSIRVKTDDGRGGTFEKALTIHVIDDLSPTDITLSNSSIDENGSAGDDVGTLTSTDSDGGPTFTYTLVSGTGSTDNSLFQINGDKLEAAGPLDFEAAGTRSVRIKTYDGKGGSFEKQFTITINNKNDAPTDISLSNSSVAENTGDNADVGTLSSTDQDAGATHSYTLVTGTGDTDNGKFQISGTMLKTAQNLDFETQSSYSVRVKTDDGAGGTFEKQFTITVTNANDAPSDITLQNSTVAENQLAPATVGGLVTTDQDSADTSFTYTFATGTGDDDNLKFQLSGNTLQTNAVFDYETKSTYKVRLKTDDGHGGTFEKAFTVTVTDVNDPPTNIALSSSSVNENQPTGTTVGNFSSTDQDVPANTFTYTFATGTGDDDNGSFTISGNQLKTGASFDFEAKASYKIRVKTDDGHGGTFEKAFTVTVTDVNDPPTDIALSKQDINENQPSASNVGTFSSTDQDVPANTFTYTLVSGTGSADNGSFTISGGTLKTAASFNFEVKNSYSIRVQTDDGHGGTFQKQFTITINDVNDAPTTVQDDYSGAIGNTKAQVGTSSSGPVVTLSGSIPLANDSDEDATFPHTVSAVPETVSSSGGGSATINADGSFTYLPGVGDKNLANDTFTYHATDGSLTSPGTATVDIANELVWYVKAGAGGDGRSNAPFSTLGSLNGAGGSGDSDGSGDYIFLYGSSTFTGGLPLEANQKLYGEPNGLTVAGNNLVAASGGTAASNPVIQNAGGDAIQLANGSDVERVNAGTSSGAGIKGASVTTSTVGGTTTVSGAAGGGVALSGAATGNIDIGSSITGAGGKSVSIQNRSGGTVNLTGAVTDTAGTGISVASNTGATINFSGKLNVSSGANSAFSATSGGTVTVTSGGSSPDSTLATTTGTALNVDSTTIGSSGLKFKSISANGATNGIVLNTTGTTAGLTVAGDGSQTAGLLDRDGSGGTIQSTSHDAVLLTNAIATIKQLNITNAGWDGVQATGSGNVTLSAVDINHPGNAGPAADGSTGNPSGSGGGNGFYVENGTGTYGFDNNSRVINWQSSQSNAILLHNTNADFTSFTVNHALISTSATGAAGFHANLNGTTDGQVSITNSEFTLIDQNAAQVLNNGSGTIRAIVQGNNFHDADATGGDGNNTLFLANSHDGHLNFTVGGAGALGNTFHNLARLTTLAGVVQVDAAGGDNTTPAGGLINGTITNNNIWNDSGFTNGRRAIDVQVEADSHNLGQLAVAITNNTVNNVGGQAIHVSVVSVGGGSVTDGNWTITGNSLGAPGTNNGIRVGNDNTDSASAIEFETNFNSFTSGADIANKLQIANNTGVDSANNATGAVVDVTNIGGTAASGTTAQLQATITNNTLTNLDTAGTGHVLDVLNSSAGDAETLNLNISGNNTTLGASTAGEIRLRQLNGTFNIQGGSGAVSANNNGDTVATTGSFGTVGSVPLPTSPSF